MQFTLPITAHQDKITGVRGRGHQDPLFPSFCSPPRSRLPPKTASFRSSTASSPAGPVCAAPSSEPELDGRGRHDPHPERPLRRRPAHRRRLWTTSTCAGSGRSRRSNSGIKYNVQDEWINTSFRPDWSDEKRTSPSLCHRLRISDRRRLTVRGKQDVGRSPRRGPYLLEWAEEKPLKPVGEWNESRIVVHGTHGEHWLNGKKLFEFEMVSRADGQSEEGNCVAPGYGISPGPIVLTHHGTPVWYRNLRIKAE
ncbi:MAG: DUF1080 domain-containing protein [Bryobacterales bacterium]